MQARHSSPVRRSIVSALATASDPPLDIVTRRRALFRVVRARGEVASRHCSAKDAGELHAGKPTTEAKDLPQPHWAASSGGSWSVQAK